MKQPESSRSAKNQKIGEGPLGTFFENTLDAMFLLDGSTIVECNRAALNLFNCTREQLISMPPDCISPERQPDGRFSTEKAPEMINLAIQNGSHLFEWVHMRLNGEEVPCEISLTAVPYQDRVGVLSVIRDQTVRVRAEKTLRDSEEQYRSLMESQQDGLFLAQDGKLALVNRALAEMIGYTAEEMVNRPFTQFIAPEDQEMVVENHRRRMAGEEVVREYQFHLLCKDGQTRVLINMRGDVAQYRGKVATLGTIRNVTDQMLAEAERARLFSILENTADFVGTSDLQGNLFYLNAAGRRMVGIGLDEPLTGKLMPQLSPAWANEIIFTQAVPAVMEKGVWLGETALIGADGNEIPISQSLMVHINKDGQLEYLSSIARDISERKKLEKELHDAVVRRGYQVQVSTQIAQEIAAAPALDELFHRVVTLVKERLGYYHTQLLRYEPALNAVVLMTGYGEIGEKMRAAGHRMEMGRGLIGVAASTGQTVVRADVTSDPDWRPNPILPDTRGEIAVPIKFGDHILGVLDVQSDQAGALSDEDQQLLEGLCGQIAIAIEGTRLREEMEERLNELNALYRATSREGWQSYTESGEMLKEYTYDRIDVHSVDPSWKAGVEQAVAEKRLVVSKEGEPVAVAPLTVRGEVIGALGVYDDSEHPMSEEELDLVQQVSDQVALALESARLFEQTRSTLSDLEDQRRTLQAVLDNMPAGLFMVEAPSGRPILTNRLAEEFLGRGISPKMVGDGLNEVYQAYRYGTGELYPAEEMPIVAGMFGETKTIDDMEVHRPDGSHILLQVTGAPVFDTSGKVVASVVIFQNITEQRKAADELRKNQAQLAEALSIAKMGYWEFDTARNVFIFNDQFYNIIGTNAEAMGGYEVTPEGYSRIVRLEGETVDDALDRELGAMPSEQSRQIINRFVRPDGSEGYMAVHFRQITDAQGRVTGMIGTNQDITEQRQAQETIAKRAVELATVAEVATTVSTIQSPDEMLQTVVDLTRQAFGLYHAHIYLFDQASDTLMLAKGAGDIGRQMVSEGRRISVNTEKSLVARAARSRQGVIANDVRSDPEFLPHPLLPETRSEMAVPMIVGDSVLGVIDIQDEQVNRFSQEDVNIITTLAAQVAVSLQNARSYARAQRQAEREALINAISERIQSTNSVESALQVAVRELGRALGARRTAVQLGLEQKDQDRQ